MFPMECATPELKEAGAGSVPLSFRTLHSASACKRRRINLHGILLNSVGACWQVREIDWVEKVGGLGGVALAIRSRFFWRQCHRP